MKRIICALGKFYFLFVKREKTEKIKNIAVIKSGAIGDILMTTPFLKALRKKYPGAKITYITGEKFKNLLEGNKNIDEIIIFDTKKLFDSGFLQKYYYFRKFAKNLRHRFDLCFILDKSYLAGLFAYRCKIPLRIGFDRSGEGFSNTRNDKYKKVKHEIDYYLELLNLPFPESDKNMDLVITKQDENFADGFFDENDIGKNEIIIGISPASTKDPQNTSSPRAWPKENYIELIKKLIQVYRAKIILFGDKNDIETINDIHSKINEKTYNSAGRTTIKQAAALIKKCKVFITHDSGLMHVAAAMDVPVISLFGPTDPRRKAPLNKKSVYIWKDTKRCEKCEIYGKFPYCKKHASTELIKIDDVLNSVDKIVNS